jgi:hypothetical protein
MYHRFDKRCRPKGRDLRSRPKKLKDREVLKRVRNYIINESKNSNVNTFSVNLLVSGLGIRKKQVDKAVFLLKRDGFLRQQPNFPPNSIIQGKRLGSEWVDTFYTMMEN